MQMPIMLSFKCWTIKINKFSFRIKTKKFQIAGTLNSKTCFSFWEAITWRVVSTSAEYLFHNYLKLDCSNRAEALLLNFSPSWNSNRQRYVALWSVYHWLCGNFNRAETLTGLKLSLAEISPCRMNTLHVISRALYEQKIQEQDGTEYYY
jgi:hypothetical protein